MELSEDVANYTRGVQMLLFCISLNGISEIAGKTRYGYRLQNGTIVSHLLCMDNTKL